MSDQPNLLDVAPVPLATPAEVPLPKAWGRLMATHEKNVRRGLHPMGRPLGAEGTCGTCQHRVRRDVHGRSYTKCALDVARWTDAPGTDIRLRWPACSSWAAKGEG